MVFPTDPPARQPTVADNAPCAHTSDLERIRNEIAMDVAERISHTRVFEDARARRRNRVELLTLPTVSLVTVFVILAMPSVALFATPLGALTQVVFVAIKLFRKL
jgi:hypothetical protein